MTAYVDPLDHATTVAEQPDFRFGEVTVEGRFVVLVKGAGKHDFDPQIHEMKDRRTEVQITVYPLSESGLTNYDQRQVIAEMPEFTRIVWPSVKAQGMTSIRELNNKFVRYELVANGTYTRKDGTTGTRTTFKFHEIFKDRDACLAAFNEARGNVHSPQDDDDAAAVDMSPAGNHNNDPVERETAKQFLAVLVKMHSNDDTALAAAIAGTPMVSKFFTVSSPEVAELRKAA